MKPYGELLKDPRWQKARLRIMERDGWECQSCFGKTSTLNVHHLRYATSGNPWDVADADLRTLCETCHHETTVLLAQCRELLRGMRVVQLQRSLGYLQMQDVCSTRAVSITAVAQAAGVADFWGLRRDDIPAVTSPSDLMQEAWTREIGLP